MPSAQRTITINRPPEQVFAFFGIPSDIQITAYEPSTYYAFKVTAGPVRPVGEFRFTPSGAETEVTLSLSAELGGG